LDMSQGVFQLDAVTFPPPVEGVSRPARIDEADELADMWITFEEEAFGQVEDAEGTRENVRRRIETQSPRHGAWVHEVDGQVVSLSGHKGPTPNGIRIGPVYTPPALRRKGYASQLVARQSQWLLDNGHRYCFLYTDLANPTSNSIYKRIGYRQIAESATYEVSPKT
ncbi:MAG: GNAT family N-acetyltransferase, partial [Actinomycetota bacterium]